MATALKISLLKFKPTDHTLAVLSRAADPEGVTDAKAVAPNGFNVVSSATQASAVTPLPLRTLRVPVDYLAVSSVDLTRDLVLTPTADAGVNTLQSTAPAIVALPTHDYLTLTVSPANATGNPLDFWVLFEEANPADPADPARRMAKGSLAIGASTAGAMIMQSVPPSGQGGSPMPIDPGDYKVLALVAGYGFQMQRMTVP